MGGRRDVSVDIERRRSPRINLYLPLVMREAGGNGEQWEKGFTVNIGRDGAYILARTPKRLHQTIDLCVYASQGGNGSRDAHRCLSAWVVRVDCFCDALWGGGLSYAIGVKFDQELELADLAFPYDTIEGGMKRYATVLE
jgi:hypothetical protein